MTTAAKTGRDRVLDAMVWCRLLDAYQRLTGQHDTVLLYHSVAAGEPNPYLDDEAYVAHMEMLRSEFRVVSADEYLWHLLEGKKLPRRSVLITFDDGFENNCRVVQPIMERLKLPWVLFGVTQGLDDADQPLWTDALRAICRFTPEERITLLGHEWETGDTAERTKLYQHVRAWILTHPAEVVMPAVRDLIAAHWHRVPPEYAGSFCQLMDAQQLRELDASPLVEIGCHTHTHPFLTRVADDRLAGEIDEPTRRLADLLGHRIRMFAYPIGDYSLRELDHVVAAGFDCAFAVIPQVGRAPRYELPRVGVYDPARSVVRAKALGLSAILRRFGVPSG